MTLRTWLEEKSPGAICWEQVQLFCLPAGSQTWEGANMEKDWDEKT